ncbi:hypothetical protein PAXRUDRAFT_9941 [Paxillus rubicundulus Ve08.2h10]|uniref:Uncharacterized protein n=1 Tax=Paxillus rubicundulus Ve08.2h10 TaxID=930991 RepID=A0A0D0EBL7_9AGAM|nr:hypothetical protein PAXRUDRAFT_9941 [Paxillus rubicundulus Ve08.2h10]
MISELDELDGLDSGLHSDLLLGPDFGELAGEIMSVVTGHSGGAVEFEEEHEEEEMSEDFNFNGMTATTDDVMNRSQVQKLAVKQTTTWVSYIRGITKTIIGK